jgi:tetrahydrodipicolinate N-succinyltransferase
MSGLKIGDGAVLSANACVVKDIPPYHIVGGNPAKLIKKRFDDDTIELLLQLQWWDLPLKHIKNIIPILSAKPDRERLVELLRTYRL